MNKIKKTVIALFLIIGIYNTQAQKEFTIEADSATSDMVFRKFVKYRFMRSLVSMNSSFISENELTINNLNDYGAGLIQGTTFAFGKWAMKPDFKVYKSFYKSPWKGYELFQMNIFEYTPNNIYIAGRTSPRYLNDRTEGYCTSYLSSKEIIAYNPKTKDFKRANLIYFSSFYRKSDEGLFVKKNPNYLFTLDSMNKTVPFIDPVDNYQLEQMLKSELLKNIYSYRFVKSGLLDSLFTPEGHIKESVTLFPLVDKLLPDFDEELLMKCDFVEETEDYKLYRFYHPGIDWMYSNSRHLIRKDSAWAKYIDLKPTYYVVAYEPDEKLVHFVSGNDIFLTKIEPCCFPPRLFDSHGEVKRDTTGDYYERKKIVVLRTLNLFTEHLLGYNQFLLPDSIRENVVRYIGEDSSFWYYQIYSEIPTMRVNQEFDETEDGRRIDSVYTITIVDNYRKVRKCYYKARMSKKNVDIVEVIDQWGCEEGKSIYDYKLYRKLQQEDWENRQKKNKP